MTANSVLTSILRSVIITTLGNTFHGQTSESCRAMYLPMFGLFCSFCTSSANYFVGEIDLMDAEWLRVVERCKKAGIVPGLIGEIAGFLQNKKPPTD